MEANHKTDSIQWSNAVTHSSCSPQTETDRERDRTNPESPNLGVSEPLWWPRLKWDSSEHVRGATHDKTMQPLSQSKRVREPLVKNKSYEHDSSLGMVGWWLWALEKTYKSC